MSKTKIGNNAQFTSSGPSSFTTIGKHCYAYSGNVTLSTSAKTQLDFYSPKEYILAKFVFTGPGQPDNAGGERDSLFRVDFNGITVAYCQRLTGSSLLGTGETTLSIIIPPLTHIQVFAYSSGSDSDYYTAVVMTGELHNG